ncbi:hypothetical protein TVAG_443100 [Trichomonas vaginalis G3]|uniref:Uncharacterized protein n=1 Tax=Trichomonas vaginalis (strain ATCC PRA-98 / G3) TaxID=412133 RepID=A2FIR2_TRIV3|nr:centrosomal protein-related family [Trichomonas vaginalis G3]EAX95198.1 hypothetical protein TVAG_443100 [Trichomonas vaginalis G3]KAI5533856.1 centrosomal protein-related family [Trichomonas vaginalis G3]|eukprot:XP_001308128.1 hypothetical protein [Trichomonas vaginalis G3]
MSTPQNQGAYNGGGDNHTTMSSSAVKFGIDSAVSDPNDPHVKENQEFQERFLKFLQYQELDSDEIPTDFNEEEEESDLAFFDLKITKPECFFDEIQSNNKYITYVSNKTAENGAKPLYLKAIDLNDGVYRWNYIECKNANVNRLNNRLILDDPNKITFFNEEGEMKQDAPLVRQTMPYADFKKAKKKVDDTLLYNFVPGTMIPISATIVSRFIRIEIFNIEFAVHPLSSKATILQNQILELYRSIENETEISRIQNYKSRIDLIRAQLKIVRDDNRKKLLQEVVRLQELRDFEEHKVREIRDMLLNSWHALKEIQESTFIIAPFILKWVSRKRNESERQFEVALLETDIGIRANEIAELEEINTGKKPNTDNIIQTLKDQRVKLGLRNPGETTWEPVLKKIEIPSVQRLTMEENNRRKMIDETNLWIQANISDKKAISSEFKMNYSLYAESGIGIRFLCTRVPKAVPVEIWQDGPTGKTVIATVNIPVVNGVPYQPMKIQFTSSQPIHGCLVQGTISAQGFVEPDFDGGQTVIHEMSKKKAIMKDLKSNPSSFISVPKFVETTKNSDPNDPKLQEILNEANVDLDPQIISNQFILDKGVIATKFSSMAPMMVHNELPHKVFRKPEPKPNNKSDTKLEDVIIDSDKWSVKDILHSLWSFFFEKRRPLSVNPIDFPSTEYIRHGSVVISRLLSAANTPQRMQMSIKNYVPLENSARVFARVFFEGVSYLTDAVDMKDGAWNESITYDMAELFGLKTDVKSIATKTIRIDLFDHVNLKQNERDQNMPEKISENHFLATLEIPVKSLIFNGGIDDVIPMISHPLHFGYESMSKPIMINLNLQSIPPLTFTIDRNNYINTESQAVAYRFKYILDARKSSNLRYVAFSKDGQNKLQLIYRNLCKLQTPPNFTTIQSLLRFVSAIPYTSEFPDDQNPTVKSPSIVMEEMSGTIEEHAVILSSFLEANNIKSKVVLGYDKVHGPSAFVLVDQNQKYLLDPVTCRIWEMGDKKCTLYRIGTIFDRTNIWFNKQNVGDTWKLSFNTDNNDLWEPFFYRNFQDEKLQISEEIKPVEYGIQASMIAAELQKKIEEEVCVAVELFRSPSKTRWVNDLSKNLRNALKKCEEAALSSEDYNFQEIFDNVKENFPDCRIIGSPFFVMANSSKESRMKMINEIKSEIKLREVFFTENESTQFACASSVLPYPHGIFAVWTILVSVNQI